MIKGPKTLLAEGITAALDEFFEVDPDAIEAQLMGETHIELHQTKLRPRTNVVLEKTSENETIVGYTTGVVDQVLFTWTWASFGNDYLVQDSRLAISGLRFKTQLQVKSNSDGGSNDENDTEKSTVREGKEAPHAENGASKGRRRSSLAEIKHEGMLELYIRHQIEHIIDALTLAVNDFEFCIELPPNESGEVSGITARGSSAELKSVGGTLGDEAHVRHRASFVNGGLCQQLSVGCIQLGIFHELGNELEASIKELPLLEPLSYSLSATRFFGERFSGITSGISGVGVPLSSSRYGNIEEMDIVVHAGLTQIGVLVQLGNLLLQKKKPTEQEQTKETRTKTRMIREKDMLGQDPRTLITFVEETVVDEEDEEHNTTNRLSEEEWREIEQDYSDNDDEETDGVGEDMYSSLMHDLMKSSVFRFPITGVSVILPNDAKLTLEALCVEYRADGTLLTVEGDYGAGILIDGYQLVNTNSGRDGASKSRWVVDLITSKFTIEGGETDEASSPNSKVAHIRWTEGKLDRLIKGWTKLLDAVKDLNLEKRPEAELGGSISNGFSISFGV